VPETAQFGVQLTHKATDLITVNAGQRYADDNETQFILAANTDYDAGSLADATYYLFGGYNAGGTAVLEADTNADGSGLSVITSGMTSLGRFIVASSAVDTTQLWTKHADGTETYYYEQLSGNFPNADVTLTHNLNTWALEEPIFYAKANSGGKLYPAGSYEGISYGTHKHYMFDSVNVLKIKQLTNYILFPLNTGLILSNSADYRLVSIIKTRLA
jgi:hypothetical protein